jgi:hypothetical protein
MPWDSSFLLSSPFGFVSFASAAVPSIGFEPVTDSLAGNVARAPSGVPGVVVDDEGAALPAGAGADEAGEAGAEDAGADDAGAEEAGAEEAGADDAGEAGAEVAGADAGGVTGAISGSSARLQPATSSAPKIAAAITLTRRGRGAIEYGAEGLARFMTFLEQVDQAPQAAEAASSLVDCKVHA